MQTFESGDRQSNSGRFLITHHLLPPDDWRAQAFYLLFFAALVIETIPTINAIRLIKVDHNQLISVISLAIAYLLLLLALFLRSRVFETRIWLGVISLYIYGMVLLSTIGPISGGRASLLTAALTACVLISIKSGVIALGANLTILLLLGRANILGLIHWSISGFSWESWVVSSLTHTILSAAVALAMALIIGALKNSLEKAQQDQTKIEHRLRMEQLVASISARVGSASVGQLEENFEWALQAMGETMQVDRAYIFALDPQNRIWNNTHEWCAEGITPQIKNLQNIPMDGFSWWTGMMAQGQAITLEDIGVLEEENPALYESLDEQDIQSLMAVPLAHGNELSGFVGFDMVREKRSWNIGDVSLLRTVGGIIARSKRRANDERELAASERRYRMLVENAPIGVMLLDQEGSVLETNPGTQMLGELASFEPGKNLLGTSPFEEAGFSKQFQRCLLGDEYCSGEINYQMINEAPRWARYHMANMQIDQSQPKRVLMMVEDTSEEHALREALNGSQRMEALGRLAGGVAHDFNNLLTVIKGYIEMILDNPQLEEKIKDDLLAVDDASNKASALTGQLLLFSRRQETQLERLDLNRAIADTSRMLERLIGEAVSLKLNLLSEPCEICANPGQIDQVIMNLVVNARDAMPEGGTIYIGTRHIVVSKSSARTSPGAHAGPYVQMSVQDTGSGIAPEVLQHIFEPFYTTKVEGKGTGLGLATVYGIVTQAGGYITVDSHLNRGTTFFINFPPAEPSDITRKSSSGPIKASSEALNTKNSILVVEDDINVRRLVTRELDVMGYIVHGASSGEMALEMILGGLDVNLVISDVVMPGISGIELVKKLCETRPEIPTILMSGYPQEFKGVQDILDQGTPLLLKPIKRQELEEAIHRVLGE